MTAWAPELRVALSSFFARRGHEVITCATAKEARSICELHEPAAVVFSAEGYGMDAVQLVRWIRSQRTSSGGKTYVLAIGDSLDESWLAMMLAAGASDCMVKEGPEDWKRAVLLMERAMENSRKEVAEISGLRRMRQRYENLFLEGPDAMLVLKPKDGRIIGVNRAVLPILGYEGKDLLGKYLSLIFPEVFAGEGKEAFENFLLHISKNPGLRYRTQEGSKKLLDLSVATITWEESSAFLLSCRDVSATLNLEKRNGSESKIQALSSFAKGVGADLNDALTSIGGNIELLGMRPDLGHDARALADSASDAVAKARSLAVTLRSVGETSAVTASGAPFLLRDVVESEVLSHGLLDDSIAPEFRFCERPIWVRGDATGMRELVHEVAVNAVESMRDGRGSRFRVHFWEAQLPPVNGLELPGGSYARVVFEDEGEGIDSANLSRVFDPYFTTRKGKRGLGLTRAAAIAFRHGGRLVANRREEGGTEIELYLPVDETVETGSGQGAPVADAVAGKTGEGKRILFLDDEAEIRLLVERALGMHGYEVFSVASGEDAIKACHRGEEFERPFDLLIFDLEIRAGLGGRETLNFLRRQGARTKAIVTTGIADDAVLANLSDHGFCGVLKKPFRLEDLIDTVATLCGVVPAREIG